MIVPGPRPGALHTLTHAAAVFLHTIVMPPCSADGAVIQAVAWQKSICILLQQEYVCHEANVSLCGTTHRHAACVCFPHKDVCASCLDRSWFLAHEAESAEGEQRLCSLAVPLPKLVLAGVVMWASRAHLLEVVAAVQAGLEMPDDATGALVLFGEGPNTRAMTKTAAHSA